MESKKYDVTACVEDIEFTVNCEFYYECDEPNVTRIMIMQSSNLIRWMLLLYSKLLVRWLMVLIVFSMNSKELNGN